MDLRDTLVVGAYIFTAGSYVFVWKVWQAVAALALKVSNHHQHRMDDIERRLDVLEGE